jgi:hypothetical protein
MRKIRCFKVTTNKETSIVECEEPLYKSIGEHVGGYVEGVSIQFSRRTLGIHRSVVMVVNEEGLIRELPQNMLGSLLYGGVIVGDIVFCRETMGPEGMDWTSIYDEDIAIIKKCLDAIR